MTDLICLMIIGKSTEYSVISLNIERFLQCCEVDVFLPSTPKSHNLWLYGKVTGI